LALRAELNSDHRTGSKSTLEHADETDDLTRSFVRLSNQETPSHAAGRGVISVTTRQELLAQKQ
jgi:hypothetical protein